LHAVAHGDHHFWPRLRSGFDALRAASALGKAGRQMQTWAKFTEGWRVVAAHVSLIDKPK